MKKQLASLAVVVVLLFLALPVISQTPDVSRMRAQSLIQVAPFLGNAGTPIGLSPVQYKSAYGLNRIPNQGQGQTIAIVSPDDAPGIDSDLAIFASYFHLGPCNFQKVKIGNPPPNHGWDLTESATVEQACALAPQANIILVEANSESFSDVFAAVAVASAPPYNATVVNLPFAFGEFQGEQAYDSYLCNIQNSNGQPVTFVAASAGCRATYPAASSCVISVGGTSLTLSTPLPPANPMQIRYGEEFGWTGGGGGVSQYEPQPAWQHPACTQSTNTRCVPDVAADGDPNTGVPVYDTYSYGGWVTVGGSSISSSDWAAFLTLVNGQRVSQNKSTLSQTAQDLYSLYYSGNSGNYFHDVTTGSFCDAGPGYDRDTGIGTYQANSLSSALVADPN
jgi:subtilase family serine protease